MKTMSAAIALCTLCLFAPSLRADEIIKKDGTKIVGFVIENKKTSVLIMDAEGRKHRVRQSDISTLIEGPETGSKVVDEKIKSIDSSDADALAEVAKWAKEEAKEKAWRLVAMQALRVNENCVTANELLGHILVGDTWYTDEKAALKARSELIERERTEAGYIKWKGGWIQKEDQPKATKNPNDWMKDETETWVETAVHMAAKGFINVNGKWVKAGTEEDKKDMEEYLNLTGQKIWIYSSKHFRLWVQGFEPDEIYEQSVLLEKTYDWFHETFEVPNNDRIWRGNRANILIFDSQNSAVEWFNKYRNRMGLNDGILGFINRSGNVVSPGNLLGIDTVPNRPETKARLPHTLVNHAAQFLIAYYSPGLPRAENSEVARDPWLPETFGVYAEHVMLKNGLVLHTTVQRYSGGGGVASKEFSTTEAGIVSKGLARDGSDTPMESLMKIQLNQLTAEHIAKTFTLFNWWMETNKGDVKKFLELRNTTETEDAIQKIFGVSLKELDANWAKFVRKAY